MGVVALHKMQRAAKRLLSVRGRPQFSSSLTSLQTRTLCSAAPSQAVVLFDSSCPLCVWEIGHYKQLDAQRKRVQWLDVRGAEGDASMQAAIEALDSVGSTPDKATKQLH